MTTERTADNCKHWLFHSCPEINNPVMGKFKFIQASVPGYYINGNDINDLNKLCEKCKKFESMS